MNPCKPTLGPGVLGLTREAGGTMVSRGDRVEIENSGPDVSKSEVAVEVEVPRPFT